MNSFTPCLSIPRRGEWGFDQWLSWGLGACNPIPKDTYKNSGKMEPFSTMVALPCMEHFGNRWRLFGFWFWLTQWLRWHYRHPQYPTKWGKSCKTKNCPSSYKLTNDIQDEKLVLSLEPNCLNITQNKVFVHSFNHHSFFQECNCCVKWRQITLFYLALYQESVTFSENHIINSNATFDTWVTITAQVCISLHLQLSHSWFFYIWI